MSRDLSEHQIKRIRRAGLETLRRLARQEAYWTETGLIKILDRVDSLLHESPADAEPAARCALEVLDRLIDPPNDLRAHALSIHGSTLRAIADYGTALARYDEALSLANLGQGTQASILRKQTVALILSRRFPEGLASVDRALGLKPDDVTALAVRSWARLRTGDYHGTLADCSVLLETAHVKHNRRSFLAGVVNASAVLRLQAAPTDDDLIGRIDRAILECRRQMPKSGSSFYSLTLPRSLIYHAEALMHARNDAFKDCLLLLRKALDNLYDKFPDDAFFAAVDLAYFYALNGQEARAVDTYREVLELSERTTQEIYDWGLNVTRFTVNRGTVNPLQALEIRTMLHLV